MLDAYWEGESVTIQHWDGRGERGFIPLTGQTTVFSAQTPPEELGAVLSAALAARVERERGWALLRPVSSWREQTGFTKSG
jgi:hypothetical protein